jgi:hypothetical protein
MGQLMPHMSVMATRASSCLRLIMPSRAPGRAKQAGALPESSEETQCGSV